MSKILFAVLSFMSATSWIMVVHYIDKISDRIKNPVRRNRKKTVYRIITAFSVTFSNHILVLLAISRLPQKEGYLGYYKFETETLVKIFKVVLLNSVLFVGNWICVTQNEGMKLFFGYNLEVNLENFKKFVVCPFLEEALFTTLAYHSYVVLNPESNPGFNFYILNSVIFSFSHLHMKWNLIHDVLVDQGIGVKDKSIRIFKIGFSLVLITFIYKCYCNWVFSRILDFWSLFILHSYCNMMGAPRGDFEGENGQFLQVFGIKIKGWIHIAAIAAFFLLGNFVLL